MTDNYSLLMVRNELKKCRNCNVNSPCCSINCEIFDKAVEAVENEVLKANICRGCSQYNNSCPGYDSSGNIPQPFKESHITIESTSNPGNSGEVVTCSFKHSKSYDADEKWLITRGGEGLPGYKRVPELAPSEELFNKYIDYWKDKPASIWWEKYKSEFMQQFKNPQFIMKLALLYEKVYNQNQNILLVCFCQKVKYCHRKIVASFLAEKGLKVQVH